MSETKQEEAERVFKREMDKMVKEGKRRYAYFSSLSKQERLEYLAANYSRPAAKGEFGVLEAEIIGNE